MNELATEALNTAVAQGKPRTDVDDLADDIEATLGRYGIGGVRQLDLTMDLLRIYARFVDRMLAKVSAPSKADEYWNAVDPLPGREGEM